MSIELSKRVGCDEVTSELMEGEKETLSASSKGGTGATRVRSQPKGTFSLRRITLQCNVT